MSDHVESIGWIIRFPPKGDSSISAFYRDVLRLPFVRGFDTPGHRVDFFWAGEAMIFELIVEGLNAVPPAAELDPDSSNLVPIFRVHGLDSVVADLRSRGARVTEPRPFHRGREAFVRDPNGALLGLREVREDSSVPHDVEAQRRWRRGEAFNVGCDSMPAGWQELGWVVRHVVDVQAMKKFYVEALGLPVIADDGKVVLLDLGDNSMLELSPGGVLQTPPQNRYELNGTFILRVSEIETLRNSLRARGVHFVHELIQWPAGALTYVTDPEGHIIGLEQRYHPSKYLSKTIPPFPEDLEAIRRQREHAASR